MRSKRPVSIPDVERFIDPDAVPYGALERAQCDRLYRDTGAAFDCLKRALQTARQREECSAETLRALETAEAAMISALDSRTDQIVDDELEDLEDLEGEI